MCSTVSYGKLKDAMKGRYLHIPDEVSPDKLSLVLEPEAAAVYCRNMTLQQRALYCTATQPFSSKNYLVVDVGGGTVDIVAYRVNHSHMEVIHQPAGDAWGGTKINLEFKIFGEEIIGDRGFSKYVNTENEATNATHLSHLNELVYETFESQKTIFGDKELDNDGKISVQLPYTFFKKYELELISNVPTMQRDVRLSGSELRITYSKVKEFYNPVVIGINACISQVLKSGNVETDTIYLVGGFGGCRYIYEVIKSHFGDKYNYITPESPDFAVIKGAVLMRRSPDLIQARIVDAMYGVRVSIAFIEGKHAEECRCRASNPNEPDQCINIFSTFVERGDIVLLQDAYMMSYTPESQNQRKMIVEIYSSSEKDVWYITGKQPLHSAVNESADVQKIGELIVPFREQDEGEESDREVDVMFDFTSTEIQVKGYEHQSETEVKVVIDFLNG